MGYPTTSATKTEWAIQQRRLPNSVDYPTTSATKQCGLSNNVGYQTVWAIQQRRLPKQSGQSNNVGYQTSVSYTSHAISATKAVRPPTACVLSMQCWLTKKVDYPSQQLSAPKECGLSTQCWLSKKVDYPSQQLSALKECGLSTQCWLSKDTAGLSKKNWLTANMDHPCSISTECLWAIQAVSTTQGVR